VVAIEQALGFLRHYGSESEFAVTERQVTQVLAVTKSVPFLLVI
jgi:hypothetical protein